MGKLRERARRENTVRDNVSVSRDPAAAEASLVPVTQLVKETTVAWLAWRPRLTQDFPTFCATHARRSEHGHAVGKHEACGRLHGDAP